MGAVATGAITIPDEGTVLDASLFDGNKDISSADLKNITKIGDGAFKATTNLKKVVMTKVKSIGVQAFTGSGLTELTLPASIESIKSMAFMNNYSLTKVTVLNPTPITISLNTFATSAQNKQKRVLYVPKGSKAAYESNENWAKNFKEIRELN